jgi:phosphoribosylformylglycinamidine synthase
MTTTAPPSVAVHRVEVRPRGEDPRARRLERDARSAGFALERARSARVYLLQAALDPDRLEAIRAGLLENAVVEAATVGVHPTREGEVTIEVHPLPGVMDPVAQTVASAAKDLFGVEAAVQSGWRYDLAGLSAPDADRLARRLLANPVVHAIHAGAHHPSALPKGRPAEFRLTHIPIRDLDDAALERLSRDAHLFLSLDEMRAIRDEYRTLGREPTDIELETLAQTWSEHCVHKTLKSTITYRGARKGGDPIDWSGRPGHTVNADGSVTIANLLKSTVAAATHELIAEGLDWTLSVFVDNAGIIAFDDDHAVCVKVETHNHPSAIEPYGGAATGIGGCIRDIIGTGLAAKPIASTDVFCVAHPDLGEVPAGCLPPRRILSEVVAGVRDYGNRMGIPTVNGAVWFDDRYVGNPLVFCGCVGVMPRHLIAGAARPGDRIIALGGRTGRDGIHGATFSSAELTDTHADEFAHAVQIGNAIEEKRVLDAILRARDFAERGPLFSAITDCGAGGFSSAVGEMGEKLGAEVHLDRAPLKYAGLTYTEIWISEAQERMVLAVPPENLPALRRICEEEHVESADLGVFGTPGRDLVLNYQGTEVGRLPMRFLHEGIPMPKREATWRPSPGGTGPQPDSGSPAPSIRDALLRLLAHPNIASKHHIIRQYDHEVQGNTVIRPLGGPLQRGPMDAAVIEPVPGSGRGLAIACGLATNLGDPERGGDPYLMALAAIDECVRNLVCVGADPDRIAILDNFCWPSCKKPENLASLVRAAEGCYDGAKAYRTPFVSGKDSLNNQFTIPGEGGSAGRTIEIPPTLLITGIGVVPDINKCVTMDAKKPGNLLAIIEPMGDDFPDRLNRVGGSHLARLFGVPEGADPRAPVPDLAEGPKRARFVAEAIRRGLIVSAHDASDGGILVAIAEMLIAGSSPDRAIGAIVALTGECTIARNLGEFTGTYVVEVPPRNQLALTDLKSELGLIGGPIWIGELTADGTLDFEDNGSRESVPVETLAAAWLGTLEG